MTISQLVLRSISILVIWRQNSLQYDCYSSFW